MGERQNQRSIVAIAGGCTARNGSGAAVTRVIRRTSDVSCASPATNSTMEHHVKTTTRKKRGTKLPRRLFYSASSMTQTFTNTIPSTRHHALGYLPPSLLPWLPLLFRPPGQPKYRIYRNSPSSVKMRSLRKAIGRVDSGAALPTFPTSCPAGLSPRASGRSVLELILPFQNSAVCNIQGRLMEVQIERGMWERGSR